MQGQILTAAIWKPLYYDVNSRLNAERMSPMPAIVNSPETMLLI
ncbi:MAG: hypothetical protein ACI8XX_002288, partial [Polaribacter sp.]